MKKINKSLAIVLNFVNAATRGTLKKNLGLLVNHIEVIHDDRRTGDYLRYDFIFGEFRGRIAGEKFFLRLTPKTTLAIKDAVKREGISVMVNDGCETF